MPDGWVWCKLIDVCHIFGRIGFRGYTKEDLVANDGAITLSPSNIIDGQMNYDYCTYISWDKYEESPEIQIENGDILLVKTGSSFGKCAYVCNLPQEATINPQFVVLKHILCNSRFLTYILQSGYARRNYYKFVLGTAIPTFTQAVLGDMYIPLPSIQEQNRIEAAIDKWFALINTLEIAKDALQNSISQAKSKILDLAIHGKLVPQDPNDEPASELLKRINPKAEITCDTAQYGNLPNGWLIVDFNSIFETISSKPYQIKQSQIKSHGIRPVVSQSMNHIEGYTDEANYLHLQSPVLVFGDHTRIVKYIDFDFVVGADGVKIINPLFYQRYAYYMILYASINIEDKGYSRHFCQIAKFTYCLPPLKEQIRIVAQIEELYTQLDKIESSLQA